MPTTEAAFGKGGILRLGFRETARHIAVVFQFPILTCYIEKY